MAKKKLTFEEIKNLDREILTPLEVSGVLGCDPYAINLRAKQNPGSLGFPVVFMGNRAKIPRRAFIKFMEGTERTEENA